MSDLIRCAYGTCINTTPSVRACSSHCVFDAPKVDPLEALTPCDLDFGSVKFSKGVKWRTVVEAAQRWKKDADTLHRMQFQTSVTIAQEAVDEFSAACKEFDAKVALDNLLSCGKRTNDHLIRTGNMKSQHECKYVFNGCLHPQFCIDKCEGTPNAE